VGRRLQRLIVAWMGCSGLAHGSVEVRWLKSGPLNPISEAEVAAMTGLNRCGAFAQELFVTKEHIVFGGCSTRAHGAGLDPPLVDAHRFFLSGHVAFPRNLLVPQAHTPF